MELRMYESDRKRKNVVYMVVLEEGRYHVNVHYIGMTSRPLEERAYEHCHRNTSAVKQYIDTHDIRCGRIFVISESKLGKIDLDLQETLELCKYYVKRGTIRNQKNRLINKDLKGLDDMLLKDIKRIANAQLVCE